MKVPRHPDLEYVVRVGGSHETFRGLRDAVVFAFSLATSLAHQAVHLDVLAWSEDAALTFAGEAGAEKFRRDPHAPYLQRFVLTAAAL